MVRGRYPVLPIVGGGHARLQPVYVRDVADGMINSLRSRDAIGQDYYMAGPEVLTCAPRGTRSARRGPARGILRVLRVMRLECKPC